MTRLKFKWLLIICIFICYAYVSSYPLKRNENYEIIESTDMNAYKTLRPGQNARRYTIKLTVDGSTFTGRAVIEVVLTEETRNEPIELYLDDLTITSVVVGSFSVANVIPSTWLLQDGKLQITPKETSSLLIVIVEYTGELKNAGIGIYRGRYDSE